MAGFESVGDRVRARRELLGMSQQEIAEKMSLSVVGYGHYERGRTEFTASQLKALARLLDAPVSYLVGEQSDEGFQDEEAAKHYYGLAPPMKQTAKEMLRLLYEQSDREEK